MDFSKKTQNKTNVAKYSNEDFEKYLDLAEKYEDYDYVSYDNQHKTSNRRNKRAKAHKKNYDDSSDTYV